MAAYWAGTTSSLFFPNDEASYIEENVEEKDQEGIRKESRRSQEGVGDEEDMEEEEEFEHLSLSEEEHSSDTLGFVDDLGYDICEEAQVEKDFLTKERNYFDYNKTINNKKGDNAQIGKRSGSSSLVGNAPKIQKVLGKGTFGKVYKVENENGEVFAVKELLNSDDSARVEADLLQTINHKHIIKYIRSYTEDNKFNIVMEFADRGTLTTMVEKSARDHELHNFFDESSVWRFLNQMSSALSYLHNHRPKHILHRDLKPDNILGVTCGEKSARFKLGDFGLAKLLTEDSKGNYLTGTKCGTPTYMAPEVWSSWKMYSFGADMFSLGCVLAFMANRGKHFFQSKEEVKEWCGVRGAKNNRQEETLRPTYSSELISLFGTMLEVDPRQRPSARDVHEECTLERMRVTLTTSKSIYSDPQDPDLFESLRDSQGAQDQEHKINPSMVLKVSTISTISTNFAFKARVISLSQVRHLHTSKFNGRVMDAVLKDSTGEIKVTAWDKDVTTMEQMVEGFTYVVIGMKVSKVLDKRFNNTGHNYQLTWTQGTRMIKEEEEKEEEEEEEKGKILMDLTQRTRVIKEEEKEEGEGKKILLDWTQGTRVTKEEEEKHEEEKNMLLEWTQGTRVTKEEEEKQKEEEDMLLDWTQGTRLIKEEAEEEKIFLHSLAAVQGAVIGSSFNCRGWIRETGILEIVTIKANGMQKSKRDVMLIDNTGEHVIKLTIWGRKAVLFEAQGVSVRVIAARVTEYQGERSLSLGFDGKLLIDAEQAGMTSNESLEEFTNLAEVRENIRGGLVG